MKLTVLMENTAQPGFVCEHGLSVYVEYRGYHLLLDTGASDLFLHNADKLGIDLDEVVLAVLSHGHYDHSGGFNGFFSRNHHAPLYLRPAALEPCYHVRASAEFAYIGIPKGILSTYGARLIQVTEKTQILPGVWLVPHTMPHLSEVGVRARMYRRQKDGTCPPDDFAHEQSLVLETGSGLILLNSCCHAGADRILQEVADSFPGQRVRLILGGFHLNGSGGLDTLGVPEAFVTEMGRKLRKAGAEVWTGHCTGRPACALLKQELGDAFHHAAAGTVIELTDSVEQ